MNIERIQSDFPILARQPDRPPLAYLDNAATSHKPRQVLAAMTEYYETANANPHRGVYRLSELSTELLERSRKKVSSFVGGKPTDLVFTKNATEALNLACVSIGNSLLQKGDGVLVTELEHHANFVPWQFHANAKGWSFDVARINAEGGIDENDFAKKLAKKPKVVAFSMASNVTGARPPVEELVSAAHEAGAIVVCDATQAVPHVPVHFAHAGVDFAAFSAHKMLGPQGIGALYASQAWLDELEPFLLGGDMVERVRVDSTAFRTGVQKFEAGTPNVAGAVGFGAATEYLSRLSMDSVQKHESRLRRKMLDELGAIEGVDIYGPTADALAIVPFNVSNVHAHDVAQILDSFSVSVRSGAHCAHVLHDALGIDNSVRASAYLYNSDEDVERLARGVEKARETFG